MNAPTTAPLATQPGPGAAARQAVSRPMAAAAGVVSVALALGVSELIAGLLPGATSLVAAVGQVAIDLQPPGAKDLVVSLFGTNDKLALEVVVVLASLGVGALLGLLAIRTFTLAAVGFAAFGVVGFLAALGDPLATPTHGRHPDRRRGEPRHLDALVAARPIAPDAGAPVDARSGPPLVPVPGRRRRTRCARRGRRRAGVARSRALGADGGRRLDPACDGDRPGPARPGRTSRRPSPA